jgi:hypothetical protein
MLRIATPRSSQRSAPLRATNVYGRALMALAEASAPMSGHELPGYQLASVREAFRALTANGLARETVLHWTVTDQGTKAARQIADRPLRVPASTADERAGRHPFPELIAAAEAQRQVAWEQVRSLLPS